MSYSFSVPRLLPPCLGSGLVTVVPRGAFSTGWSLGSGCDLVCGFGFRSFAMLLPAFLSLHLLDESRQERVRVLHIHHPVGGLDEGFEHRVIRRQARVTDRQELLHRG